MDAAGGTAAEGVWGPGKLKDMEELVDQVNDPAGGRNGQADLAMEDLLGHGETRTKEGRELGTEWIMKRFCRIE